MEIFMYQFLCKMNIAILFDENDIVVKEKVYSLKEYISNSKEIKQYNFNFISNVNFKSDIYLIISNNTNVIRNYINKIKYKDEKKYLIVTSNQEAEHVLECVSYTKNLLYLKKTPEDILTKIIKIYEENNY